MSIWASVGPGAIALDGHNEAANYRAEGTPDINVSIDTAKSWHDHIRLTLWTDDNRLDVCALLSPKEAAALRDSLNMALTPYPAPHDTPVTPQPDA